jgi:hypothetical protein
MKTIYKIVALTLLLVVATSTAMAAIPCQTEQKGSMHCGAGCPMMGAMRLTFEHSTASIGQSSCCQISGQPQAPVKNQASPEQFSTHAIVAMECAVAPVPFVQKTQSSVGQSDLRRNLNAPALLCTFLI